MATVVIMPRQGQSVESCVITAWNKKLGDNVAEADILFSYETDKSAFDKLATVGGTLLSVYAEEGDDVECLTPVCVIGQPGEDISALSVGKAEDEAPAAEPEAKDEEAAPAPSAQGETTSTDGKMKISPRAKHLAERTDADLSQAVPTGPDGRIIERDVNKLLDEGKILSAKIAAPAEVKETAPVAPANAPAAYEDVKLSGIRKTIARNMVESLTNLVQLTLNTSFDATQILEYRKTVRRAPKRWACPTSTSTIW